MYQCAKHEDKSQSCTMIFQQEAWCFQWEFFLQDFTLKYVPEIIHCIQTAVRGLWNNTSIKPLEYVYVC